MLISHALTVALLLSSERARAVAAALLDRAAARPTPTHWACPRCGDLLLLAPGATVLSERDLAAAARLGRKPARAGLAELVEARLLLLDIAPRCHSVVSWPDGALAYSEGPAPPQNGASTKPPDSGGVLAEPSEKAPSSGTRNKGVRRKAVPAPSPEAARLAAEWMLDIAADLDRALAEPAERRKRAPKWCADLDRCATYLASQKDGPADKWSALSALVGYVRADRRDGFCYRTAIRCPAKLLQRDKQGRRWIDAVQASMGSARRGQLTLGDAPGASLFELREERKRLRLAARDAEQAYEAHKRAAHKYALDEYRSLLGERERAMQAAEAALSAHVRKHGDVWKGVAK